MERPLFIPRRCRLKIVSGISTSFPLLSQSGRLITHVLLTRPPLTSAIFQYKYFHMARSVRLACVRHAASVHPEPGSNSSLCIQSFSLRKRICSLLSLTLFVNSSSIVQFSMTLRFPSHQVAISIYHRKRGWSTPFSQDIFIFSNFLKVCSDPTERSSPVLTDSAVPVPPTAPGYPHTQSGFESRV